MLKPYIILNNLLDIPFKTKRFCICLVLVTLTNLKQPVAENYGFHVYACNAFVFCLCTCCLKYI